MGPLGPTQAANMVDSLSETFALPSAVAAQIVRKTDGVPLFVEEIARALKERNGRSIGENTLRDAAELNIPASLDESLMARLDRSGIAKADAQAAAVIGRSVRRDVLASVCEIGVEDLDTAGY